ncbi:hypothetical protein HW555_002198 [Spodoptera exigua]|uniref:Uncharacterized protein n=1 Tax=Spodoptera exigua TaxID=7107 RepID=A0A835LAE8_SPOEX|nr:hypothetical protein HW555_002198 [Spodoptera exigua]
MLIRLFASTRIRNITKSAPLHNQMRKLHKQSAALRRFHCSALVSLAQRSAKCVKVQKSGRLYLREELPKKNVESHRQNVEELNKIILCTKNATISSVVAALFKMSAALRRFHCSALVSLAQRSAKCVKVQKSGLIRDYRSDALVFLREELLKRKVESHKQKVEELNKKSRRMQEYLQLLRQFTNRLHRLLCTKNARISSVVAALFKPVSIQILQKRCIWVFYDMVTKSAALRRFHCSALVSLAQRSAKCVKVQKSGRLYLREELPKKNVESHRQNVEELNKIILCTKNAIISSVVAALFKPNTELKETKDNLELVLISNNHMRGELKDMLGLFSQLPRRCRS